MIHLNHTTCLPVNSRRTYNTYVLYVNVFHTRIVLRIAHEILPPSSVTFSSFIVSYPPSGISPVVGKTVSYYEYFVVSHSGRMEKKKKNVPAFDTKRLIRRLNATFSSHRYSSRNRLNLFRFNNRRIVFAAKFVTLHARRSRVTRLSRTRHSISMEGAGERDNDSKS